MLSLFGWGLMIGVPWLSGCGMSRGSPPHADRSDSGARNSPITADKSTLPTAPKKIPTRWPGFECCWLSLECFPWATGFLVGE